MQIIDAHLHLFPNDPQVNEMVRRAGHENSTAHLRQAWRELGMVHGVVMGNYSLDPAYHAYPEDMFHYCVGLDIGVNREHGALTAETLAQVEANLRRESCCGIKLYPGYNQVWLYDAVHEPLYALAAQYQKPVAVHMGLTSFANAHMKYCHPLVLDQVAADHPETNFVMCHFGNPFLESAVAVLVKNQNVSADLSGLLEGTPDLERYFQEQSGFLGMLQSWMQAIGRWDSLLFGTDWPLVNLERYVRFIQRLTPERHWDKVFFENANRVYGLGL